MKTADILSSLFLTYVYDKKSLCVANSYYWSKDFETDFLAVTKAGYASEFEVKVSKTDFKKDFEKKRLDRGRSFFDKEAREWKEKYDYKHDLLKEGKSGLKHFYFCTPAGLVPEEDIPEYAGWITFQEPRSSFQRNLTMKVERTAPKLPNATKMTDKQEKKIQEAQKWQYYKSKMTRFVWEKS